MKTLLLALSLFAPLSLQAAPAKTIWLAEIRGTINPASSDYFKTAIQKAEAEDAQALIVELDTPGGLVSSVREMAQAIDQARVPVVVYVTPAGAAATSAGALLMLASHVAAMSPGTNIGAAHPVGGQGEEIKGPMGEKVTNDTAAFARGLAELKGRNRELAEQIVSKSKSLTAEEALKQRLVEILAPARAELIAALNGRSVRVGNTTRTIQTTEATLKKAEMTTGQTLLHFLANPTIAAMLMTLGVFLIYVEFSAPGVGVPGVLGAISLIVAFMSLQLLPIRAGGLVLLAAGALMLIAEPFAVSHGALAAGGIIAFVLGLIWVVDPASTGHLIGPAVWIPIAIGLGSLVALVAWGAARIRTESRRALKDMGGSAISGLAGYPGHVEAVDPGGFRGKVLIRGETWDFESDEPVERGQKVQAISAEGMRIRVKKAP